MATIHPRQFAAEFVEPAHVHFLRNSSEAHLALHAIAQFDILAEVTALWLHLNGRPALGHGEAKSFRDAQGVAEPVLAIIRDIHDSHKHGRLNRKGGLLVSQGQRPALVPDGYKIDGVVRDDGGPVVEVESVNITLDDGTPMRVRYILRDAWRAWEREYGRLGVPALP